ncbi:MAG: hypothetical protein ABL964_10000 [Steroidobacteraceae bacterium]
MALVRTDYTPDAFDDTGSASRTTGSFTFPNNSLVIVIAKVTNDFNNATPVLSISDSNGLTWTAIADIATGGASAYEPGVRAWRATGTGAAGTITITSTGAVNIRRWRIEPFSYTGHNAASPIGETGTNGALATDGAASITLSGTSAASSEVLSSLAGSLATGTTINVDPGTSHAEIYDAPSSGWATFQTQSYSGATGTASWTDTLNGAGSYDKGPVGIGFEVKAASVPVFLLLA